MVANGGSAGVNPSLRSCAWSAAMVGTSRYSDVKRMPKKSSFGGHRKDHFTTFEKATIALSYPNPYLEEWITVLQIITIRNMENRWKCTPVMKQDGIKRVFGIRTSCSFREEQAFELNINDYKEIV